MARHPHDGQQLLGSRALAQPVDVDDIGRAAAAPVLPGHGLDGVVVGGGTQQVGRLLQGACSSWLA